ncbi:vegetative incompatibility protein het-e-1 [Fusarium langsethiae]|uniref:Vegetative incompatibility protein het-e-1 n=1 Tax=Fusarium langsethiae TaxID=179993 RepID=A0A0N0DCD1_FUSLA|nr:vegetative incompatibility protein het-e-1 [Fusarium langsethiae]GKU06198.1 unnamed protein product [Fusarium langsethiae]GKU22016.1 unnamed protein product [Fusarium langsethiae]
MKGSQTTDRLLIKERRLAIQNVEPGRSPVETFLSAWPRVEPHYRTMVERLKSALEAELSVRCTVSARVKSLSSITKSIERRQMHRGKRYKNTDEIFDDIHDLAGFRVVVDYPSGIETVNAFITTSFQLRSTNIFKADRKVDDAWKPIFGSFQSQNHHVILHPDAKYPLSPFCGILFEVQVLSLAESLYNRLAHPLLYKKSSGELSVKDQKMIDVTHGISLCYWICLSCVEDRLEGNKRETIPSPVQEVARLDGTQNADMDSFVKTTPYSMPSSRAAIPIEKCLDLIKDLSMQAMSSDQLHNRLSVLLNGSTPISTTNVNSGSGNIMQNYGSGSNNMYSAGGNIAIGREDIDNEIRNAFWVTDPRAHKEDIEERKGNLIEDSYRWILKDEQFKKWYEEDCPLLWLNGDPGKGKTMSICGIINHINILSNCTRKGLNTCLSYFFCDASDSNLNNATSVLRGIIYSLIFQNSTALSCVRERYKDLSKPLSDTRLAWPVLQRLFTGILDATANRKTYLIIDALDECREDQDRLLEFIVKQSSMLPVKWLVSSRKWPLIKEVLRTFPALLELRLEDNETEVSAAVSFYITRQVKSLSAIKGYNKERKEAVERHLRLKASGIFLWVSLVCRMLKQIPAWQTMKKLDSFPAGLDALYGRMLEQIQPSSGPGSDPVFDKLYGQIVSFALSALQPLSLDELRCLVDNEQIAATDFEDIIDLCGSFLTVQHRVVHLIHGSAKDHLLNEASGFKFNLQQQHAVLFSRSLSNLSQSLRRDVLDLVSTQPRAVQDALGPIRYQFIHWISHLAQCESSTLAQEFIEDGLVDSFLRQNFLFWIEALGHFKFVGLGISAMLKLDQIMPDHASHIKDLVQDQVRYIRYCRFGIEQSPLQVYYLLKFSPYQCITRKIYGPEAPDWFTLQQGVHDYWSPCIMTMEGHTDEVRFVSFSHDGRLLASASADTTVKIWDVSTGTCLHTFLGHHNVVAALAFSTKNYKLATGHVDGTIKIWDADSATLVRTLHGHHGSVGALAFSKNGRLIASGSHGTIKCFDTISNMCTRTIAISGRRPWVLSIAYTHDDQILSSGIPGAVLIWDLRIWVDPHRIELGDPALVPRSLIASQANELFFSVEDRVEIWNPAARMHIRTIRFRTCGSDYFTIFSPDD